MCAAVGGKSITVYNKSYLCKCISVHTCCSWLPTVLASWSGCGETNELLRWQVSVQLLLLCCAQLLFTGWIAETNCC